MGAKPKSFRSSILLILSLWAIVALAMVVVLRLSSPGDKVLAQSTLPARYGGNVTIGGQPAATDSTVNVYLVDTGEIIASTTTGPAAGAAANFDRVDVPYQARFLGSKVGFSVVPRGYSDTYKVNTAGTGADAWQ